jgi:hypothetical protein
MMQGNIILLESDSIRVDNIRSNINIEFQFLIKTVEKFGDLLISIQQNKPQLIILGKSDKFNYFEISEQIHKIHANLPIILLSRDLIIFDSYRDALQDIGVTAIAERDYEKLNQILDKLEKPIVMHLDRPNFTGEMMLSILQEIMFISSKHFSLLVLGNHWRKTHQDISATFPSLENWSVDYFGKVSCCENILAQELTDEDIQGLTLWLQQIIEEGKRITADFREILNNSNTSLLAKYFLEGIC